MEIAIFVRDMLKNSQDYLIVLNSYVFFYLRPWLGRHVSHRRRRHIERRHARRHGLQVLVERRRLVRRGLPRRDFVRGHRLPGHLGLCRLVLEAAQVLVERLVVAAAVVVVLHSSCLPSAERRLGEGWRRLCRRCGDFRRPQGCFCAMCLRRGPRRPTHPVLWQCYQHTNYQERRAHISMRISIFMGDGSGVFFMN